VLDLDERAVRTLVVPALRDDVPTVHCVEDGFVTSAALARVEALAHVADATVAVCSDEA
jgi:hypothetical protein